MKNFVLIYIAIPENADHPGPNSVYRPFLSKLGDVELKGAKSMRLAENCWLLERESDVSALARIVSVAEGFRLGVGVKYLSES